MYCLEGKEPKMKTREDRIGELETQFKKMEARNYVTSNMSIGRGETLEAFPMTHLNIQKNPDLMPCPRRPKKWNIIVIPNFIRSQTMAKNSNIQAFFN